MTKKVIHVHEFDHCNLCPYNDGEGSLSPIDCTFFDPPRSILGFSSKTYQIRKGERYPDWCPLVERETYDATVQVLPPSST
jgi:hypothetical protein